MTESFTFVDDVPESGNPVPDDLPSCVVCGAPVEYSGRGRKPKYCSEHKPSRGQSAVSGKSSVLVTRAIDELTVLYGVLGQGIKFRQPLAGELIFENRDKLAESYRMMLETNARFRKLFQKIESSAAILPIIAAHGQLAMTIYAASQMQHVPVQTPDVGNGDN